MGKNGNRILGAALVAIGLLMLLGELGVHSLRVFWPAAVLAIGVATLLDYLRKRDDAGKVFTGTTLGLLGVFLLLVTQTDLSLREHFPFFLAAPGLGLLAMSRADVRRRDAMVPGWLAIALAAVLYFFTLGIFVNLVELVFDVLGLLLKVLVPLGLIAGGAWMLFQQRRSDPVAEDMPEKVEPAMGAAAGAAAGAAEAATAEAAAAEAEQETVEAEETEAPAEAEADAPAPEVEDAEVVPIDEDEAPIEPDAPDDDAPRADASDDPGPPEGVTEPEAHDEPQPAPDTEPEHHEPEHHEPEHHDPEHDDPERRDP